MSFDGIVTRAVVHELSEALIGGRVDKIYQQEKDELLIYIHNNRTNYKLVLSSTSNNPRIHLTDYSKKNPINPPMFCMLLRKHLIGGTILNIEQLNMDRVIFLDISALDELGQPSEKRLIIEIMGKHSNIILIDKFSFNIIDSIKRVYEDMSRVRQVLPGMVYEYPPLQDKSNPLDTSKEEFLDLVNLSNKNLHSFKFLYFNYQGLSPLISREICFNANIDIDRNIGSLNEDDMDSLYDSFNNYMKLTEKNQFTPNMVFSNNKEKILSFHALDINHLGVENKEYIGSISSLLDNFYMKRDVSNRIDQKSQSIKKSVGVKLDRSINKLSKQEEELVESKDREKYKIYADLISANLHKIPKGADSIVLNNFYDENMEELNVPLDIKLSPVANAQKYYRRYSKLKNANILLVKQIATTKNEIDYLENVILGIENSTEDIELDEIKEELIKEGYIKNTDRNKKKKQVIRSKPLLYISSEGFNIFVGKNNKQNDHLTLKMANKDDIWLHAQKMPGSHVVIERSGRDIPSTTLEEAAILAAYFSKGKNSNNVPVDYTERKNVRKPRNAKTGMVIYNDFKTISISPSKNLIDKIKKVEN